MQISLKVQEVEKRTFKPQSGEAVQYAVIGGMTSDGDKVEVTASAAHLPKVGDNCAVVIKDCKRLMLGVYKVRGIVQ